MGSWFSKKPPKSKVTDQDRAVLQLKRARDSAMRYKKKMETESGKYTVLAKRALQQKQKSKALMFLKLRKYREQQITKVDAQLLRLHETVSTIEWETQNVEFLNGLQAGTAALNALHEQVSVEDAERILDDSADAIARQNEIDELLTGSMSTEDDEEVLAELAQIEAAQAAELGLTMPDAPVLTGPAAVALAMPDAPTDEPVVESKPAAPVQEEEPEMVAA